MERLSRGRRGGAMGPVHPVPRTGRYGLIASSRNTACLQIWTVRRPRRAFKVRQKITISKMKKLGKSVFPAAAPLWADAGNASSSLSFSDDCSQPLGEPVTVAIVKDTPHARALLECM